MKLSNRGMITWITIAVISLIVSYVILLADFVSQSTWRVLLVIVISVLVLVTNIQARKYKNQPVKYFLWFYLPLIVFAGLPVLLYFVGPEQFDQEEWGLFLKNILWLDLAAFHPLFREESIIQETPGINLARLIYLFLNYYDFIKEIRQ